MAYEKHAPDVLPFQMLSELAWASWETIIQRSLMMAQSTCSAAEYRRMLDEKTSAILEIGELLSLPHNASAEAFLTPWHSRATANAKRLRSK